MPNIANARTAKPGASNTIVLPCCSVLDLISPQLGSETRNVAMVMRCVEVPAVRSSKQEVQNCAEMHEKRVKQTKEMQRSDDT